MSKIEPVRPLVLTTEQHALLGELVEIMGQVESMLIESVKHVDPSAAGKLSKLTAGPQAKAWAKTIRGRVRDPAISAMPSPHGRLSRVLRAARITSLLTIGWRNLPRQRRTRSELQTPASECKEY